ncbi:MAG: beta-methylgalactoside transporter, partial [Firmicutes bacterium]|nr:beta-methylgalactoside transporter [Bacillota bacterium]
LENLGNLIRNMAPRLLIAFGVSGALITTGTDLSAGRQVGLAGCIAATLLQRADYASKVYPNLGEMNMMVVLLIVVAVGALIGLLNGAIIAFLHIHPFIATLGTQTFIYGVCLIFTGAQPIGGLRTAYTALATNSLFGFKLLPFLGLIALGIGLFMWVLYNYTPYGKRMYAIGGNEVAAEVSGINVNAQKLLIYTLAGMLYAIAGYMLGAKAGGTSVNLGFGYELEAIAACVIGGVSFNGGVGRISGIVLGVLIFEALKIVMNFFGIPPEYTYIVQGAVIIFAVALDMRKYVAKK